jgi:acetyl-CoA carboxylase carboxyltransferase component
LLGLIGWFFFLKLLYAHLVSLFCFNKAGADLTEQAKVFHNGGKIFYSLTKRSQAGIPSISVVFGSSTAGGAYTPGMSDYVVMVKKQAKVYLAGPPLVKMATGETTDHETLGGAEMHSKVSGSFLSGDPVKTPSSADFITRCVGLFG